MEVDINKLKEKTILKHLHNSSLKALTEVAITTKHKNNDKLFNAGDDDKRAAFLINGSVTLKSIDGRVVSIDHNHSMSQFALSNLKPRMYSATAASDDTILLWIKDEVLDKIISENLQSQKIAVSGDLSVPARVAVQTA